MSYLKEVYINAKRLCRTAVVDDDFPEVNHHFVSSVRRANKLPEMPTIVCLCGSTKFKEEFNRQNSRLTLEGFIVLSVGLFGHADGLNLTDDQKAHLDELHKRKIDLADMVFVINPGGYIGGSTHCEIEYTKINAKVIRYFEPVAL